MHTVVQRWTCDYIQWYVQTTPPAAPKFDGERRVEVRQRWPESGHRVRHHCALIMFNHYVCLWSKLNGCMRQKGSNAFTFMDPGETRAWQKQKWHRPGFRQGIGALPLLSLPWKLDYCIRLMYTAIYTQATWIGCWCQTLWINREKFFKLIGLKIQFWKCVQFDWTEWPWARFHPIGQPSGRNRKSRHMMWNTYQDSYSTVPSANVRL